VLTRTDIKAVLPHREPFLFVDRITEVVYGQRAVGWIDDVSRYPTILAGHFPGFPLLPGAILVEALGQVGAVGVLGLEENRGKVCLLANLDDWQFRAMARPGDCVRLEAEFLKLGLASGSALMAATIDGRLAAQGKMTFVIVDRDDLDVPRP
jgi:3-hydroxyacyl-[acyl-carrier-protein] dehydratase